MSMMSRAVTKAANVAMAVGELVAPSVATYAPPAMIGAGVLLQTGCGTGGKPTDPYAAERAKIKKGFLVEPEMEKFRAAANHPEWMAHDEGGIRHLRVKHDGVNFHLRRHGNHVTLHYDGIYQPLAIETTSPPQRFADDLKPMRDHAKVVFQKANAHAVENEKKAKAQGEQKQD